MSRLAAVVFTVATLVGVVALAALIAAPAAPVPCVLFVIGLGLFLLGVVVELARLCVPGAGRLPCNFDGSGNVARRTRAGRHRVRFPFPRP